MALTVGVATVLEAREVVVVVTGQRKSLALSKGMSTPSKQIISTDLFIPCGPQQSRKALTTSRHSVLCSSTRGLS